jgi:hypothetical protein
VPDDEDAVVAGTSARNDGLDLGILLGNFTPGA